METGGLDELLRRAARRDAEALGRLVDLYSPRLFGLLYRLTASRDAADDLLQETFLRVVRTIDQYEHSGKFEAWLFRIAANLARDRARQRGRRGVDAALDEAHDGAGAPASRDSAGPDAALMRRERGEKLSVALNELSDADREIIMLRHYSELSFQEIAELLGVPLGTALARAHRALAKLREIVGDV
ncbi:ECF RNA polymerase sigma factor SigW [Phycisphaerae bacterium RAS1]|nr:ECF RNA polymerase sigma factor SigW [Phycisphaerae bacterium RAS1]